MSTASGSRHPAGTCRRCSEVPRRGDTRRLHQCREADREHLLSDGKGLSRRRVAARQRRSSADRSAATGTNKHSANHAVRLTRRGEYGAHRIREDVRRRHVAYSVVGDGPIDLVFTGGYTISIDSYDDEPHLAHMWRRLASFSRLIRFDMRGIGLSDPFDPSHPADDSRHGHRHGRSHRRGRRREVCVLGVSGAATSAIELAATRPDRVSSLVLVNAAARYVRADDYPYGYEQDFVDSFLATNMDPTTQWTLDDPTSSTMFR